MVRGLEKSAAVGTKVHGFSAQAARAPASDINPDITQKIN
jgi:hypothetical protein